MQLALKKKRGEAAKNENPLWEQGVDPLHFPREFAVDFQANLHEGKAGARRPRKRPVEV
jgi:hypothetical protein